MQVRVAVRLAHTLAVAVALVLAVGVGSASAQVEPYEPTGEILVDSGFRPDVNGFSFPNYGFDPGVRELTRASMIEMFGAAVCVGGRTSPCILTPPAARWMAAQSESNAGGHCYGFSTSAQRFFTGGLSPSAFGALSVPALDLFGSRRVQELLARTQVHQMLPAVRRRIVWGSPNKLLRTIQKVLAEPGKESWTVAVFNRYGGHAVTPYAVEERGAGRRNVLVYDNNWPGITRAIRFNTNKNTYAYVGGERPEEPLLTYRGSARTAKVGSHIMGLYPVSPGFREQRCWFCGRRGSRSEARSAGASGQFEEIHLTGNPANHGHLLIEDAKGRKLGYHRGKLVNQIPRAEIVRSLTTHDAPEPVYRVPAGIEITVTIDGSGLKRPDTEELSIIGPSEVFYVTPIRLRPNQRDRLFLKTGDGIVTYSSDRKFGRHAPAVAASIRRGRDAKERHYVFAAVSLRPQATSIQLQADFDLGAFGVAGIDSLRGPARYYTTLSRSSRRGTDNWVAPGLRVDDNEVSVVLFDRAGKRNSRVPVSIFRKRDLEQVRTARMTPDRGENRASDRERKEAP